MSFADLTGAPLTPSTAKAQKFLNFMQFFLEILAHSYVGVPPGGSAPSILKIPGSAAVYGNRW